jgi:hypothetical protein
MTNSSATKEEKRRMAPKLFANPADIARVGQQIYDSKYKAEYEEKYPGQFAAIDVTTDEAFVSPTPEAAIEAARKASPRSYLHLIRIGSPGAFKVSYTSNASGEWLFRQNRQPVPQG